MDVMLTGFRQERHNRNTMTCGTGGSTILLGSARPVNLQPATSEISMTIADTLALMGWQQDNSAQPIFIGGGGKGKETGQDSVDSPPFSLSSSAAHA